VLSAHGRSELGAKETSLLRRLVTVRTEPLEERELPDDGVSWESLFRSASRHRLAPLAAKPLLEGSASRRAPIGVLERFQNAVALERARAVLHLHHLDEIGTAAGRAVLKGCLLKGAAFARALYPDPSLRPMSDLDILMRAPDRNRWASCLDALGYAVVDRSDHATCFRRRQTGVLVELHHALTSQASYLGLDAEAMLDRSVRLPDAEGIRFSTLSWEDHLLHLCLHASFQHGMRQAAVNAWDARCIVERADFDVRVFLARASEARLAPWVYGGLSMSEAVFPHEKLEQARRALESTLPRRMSRKSRRFRAEMLLSPDPDSVWGTPIERLAWLGVGATTISLLFQLTYPRTSSEGPTAWARLARVQHLVRNHGIAAIRAVWHRRSGISMGPTSASLGEVRDV
jgi:hypothetical protein